ncbi:uncharacterized protein LOC115877587 [Sitophilus oryzae]|uniref:Uncharacterized protein LOC115877587 n=1 Tax=Sitophilus oryzae TaxID=7048 RepID=A0A6J2XG47_SITOR|nr:uncharacterized protein LOC115877587 [Sitophilus oryzae]
MPRNGSDIRRRTKQRKRIMHFGTWNVQSISRKMDEVLYEINKLDIDLAVLTETKKKSQGSENLGMYDYFYSGVRKEKRAGQGVAILIHRKYRKYATTWEGISERIIKINMNIRGYRLTIIGVYAVNDDSPTASKETFFQQLNDEIIKTGKTS